MSKPRSAYDADRALARSARDAADGVGSVGGAADRVSQADAELNDVVQKFERVYAQLGSGVRASSAAPRAEPLARDALRAEEASPVRDAAKIFDADAQRTPATPLEDFEFPDAPVPSPALQTQPRVVYVSADDDARRSLWPRAVAGACVALVVGVALGYLIGPHPDKPVPAAKIEASEEGGTKLRLDPTLPAN